VTSITLDRPTHPSVTVTSRVELHPLRWRRDGPSWVVGRAETGEFVRVAPLVHRAMAMLADGCRVGEVEVTLRAESGDVLDVVELVGALQALGFVSAVDGGLVDEPSPPPPSLPWIEPRYVRWLLHPVTTVGALVVIAAGVAMLAIDPGLAPRPDDLVWSRSSSAVLAGNAMMAWSLVFLHELGHLTTARAAGVPGRIRLGTRLLFLVAETDVTGVWAEPRRTRLTVYLAGMAVNALVASTGVLVLAATSPTGVGHDVLMAVVLMSALQLPFQLMIFMRTDLYFVVQDLTGCSDLYTDATRYLRTRAWRLLGSRRPDRVNPVAAETSAHEERVVTIYTLCMVAGTVVALAVTAAVLGPTLVRLLSPALSAIAERRTLAATFDGAMTLLVVGGGQVLWIHAWWRRHGHRFRRPPPQPTKGGDP
jgi:putative peptide zinc metalloprotease protein